MCSTPIACQPDDLPGFRQSILTVTLKRINQPALHMAPTIDVPWRSRDLTLQAGQNGLFTPSLFESIACGHHASRASIETHEVSAMNHDTISGQWKQLSGQIKKQWGKLTDDDLKVVEGNAEMLAGRLQERYGIAREEAEQQVRDFEENLSMSRQKSKPLHH
jgi:uncharacterized protein YjbJ (UPF0337 family)